MDKEKYESPKFDFQEMRLLERVADVCWGKSHKAFFDEDKDGKLDIGEKMFIVSGDSCNDARLDLMAQLKAMGFSCTDDSNYAVEGAPDHKKYTIADVKENVNSPIIIEIYS